jgi:hypothetical protein
VVQLHGVRCVYPPWLWLPLGCGFLLLPMVILRNASLLMPEIIQLEAASCKCAGVAHAYRGVAEFSRFAPADQCDIGEFGHTRLLGE